MSQLSDSYRLEMSSALAEESPSTLKDRALNDLDLDALIAR